MPNYLNYTIEELLLDDSFVHYCLGTNEEASAQWREWLAAYPEQEQKLEAARKLLFSLGIRLTREEKQVELEKLKAAVVAGNAAVNRKNQKFLGLSRRLKPVVAIAAALLLFFGGYQWSKWITTSPVSQSKLAYEIVESRIGERKKIELVDGSLITLNSNSSVKIPVSFNTSGRTIKLEGEALFEVAPNKEMPFSVHASGTKVLAVGTSFKVRSYAFEKVVIATLLEGSVQITQDKKKSLSTLLSPGQQLEADKKSGLFKVDNFNLITEENWKEGKLIFLNSSPEQIRQQLQSWFGVEVQLEGDVRKTIRLNGEFNNKALNDVLAAISYVTGLSHKFQDKKIILLSD